MTSWATKALSLLVLGLAAAVSAQVPSALRPDQVAFRGLFKSSSRPTRPSRRGAAHSPRIGDPGVTVTALPPVRPAPPAPPLAEHIIGPMQKLATRYWPGIPVIPVMANGYTDATFLGAVGIPTYGVPGMWGDPDGNGVHGLNERIEVRAVYVGQDYLFDLIKAYAD